MLEDDVIPCEGFTEQLHHALRAAGRSDRTELRLAAMRLHIFAPDQPPRPDRRAPSWVRIHGGGWVGGAPEDDEALNDHICRTCRVAIVSPEYRLAPENGITILDDITLMHDLRRSGTT